MHCLVPRCVLARFDPHAGAQLDQEPG